MKVNQITLTFSKIYCFDKKLRKNNCVPVLLYFKIPNKILYSLKIGLQSTFCNFPR